MTREQALKLLRGGPDGIKEFNQLRWNGATIPDLSGAGLRGANLSDASLSGAELSGAELMGTNLGGADLSGADLSGADLGGANLRDAELPEASLVGVNLDGANLIHVDLNSANLACSNLSGADLRTAVLRNTNLTDTNLSFADFSDADLIEANLSYADLTSANFSSAQFAYTNCACDLSEAIGLEEAIHHGPSLIDIGSILSFKGDLPETFLRGCGLRDEEIEYFRSVVGSPIRFYSCFISYSHEDKQFARRLHDALQGKGIRCWLDEHQVLPGDEIHELVNKAIRVWDKVLLCCSKDSLTSWWVDNEIAAAFSKEQRLMKERGEKVLALIPLDLDGYVFSGWDSGKKETVLQRVVTDFKGWDKDNPKFERELDKVIKALRADEGSREKPPKPKL